MSLIRKHAKIEVHLHSFETYKRIEVILYNKYFFYLVHYTGNSQQVVYSEFEDMIFEIFFSSWEKSSDESFFCISCSIVYDKPFNQFQMNACVPYYCYLVYWWHHPKLLLIYRHTHIRGTKLYVVMTLARQIYLIYVHVAIQLTLKCATCIYKNEFKPYLFHFASENHKLLSDQR